MTRLALAAVFGLALCQAGEAEFLDPGTPDSTAQPRPKPLPPPPPPVRADKSEQPINASVNADKNAPEQPIDTVDKSPIPDAGDKPEKAAAAAAPEKAAEAAPDNLFSVESLLNPPVPESEKPLHDMLAQAFKSGEAGGRGFLKDKALMDISARLAAFQALERNLPLQIAAHDTEFRRAAVWEARAAFLPVFNLSGRYDNTNTFERKEELSMQEKIQKRNFVKTKSSIPGAAPPNDPRPFVASIDFFRPPTGPNEVVFIQPKDPTHYYLVDTATFTVQRFPSQPPPPAFFGAETVFTGASLSDLRQFFNQNNIKLGYVDPGGVARELPQGFNYSVASKKDRADVKGTFSLTIEQQLPWGPFLSVTETPVYHNQSYDRFGHNFDRPWFSTFTAAMFIPLPWTKNFGPYAPQDVAIKLAKQDREISMWNFKAQINTILRETDLRFLTLVNALRNLDSTAKTRKTVEALQAQTTELFGLQRTTQFGKDQVDAEVLRVKAQEELAWNSYIAASNALVELLNLEANTVLAPVGYQAMLDQPGSYATENARAVGLENRPELKSQAAATKSAEIRRKFAKVQERPDVSVTGSATFTQTQVPNGEGFRGVGIGYEHLNQSLGEQFDEDSLVESYTVNFRRSLFQRGENARVTIAERQLDQQRLSARVTENTVEQQINNALARLDSAKAAIENARTRLETALKAYDLTVELQKAGRITEFEVISKNQERLDAEIRLNEVLTNYKQAETELLFAQGTLAAQYPERTAPNAFDKYRLKLLKESGGLQFFGDGKEKKAP